MQSVLITGASTGIGKDAALKLARRGYRVFAGARQEKDLTALGNVANVIPIKLDVTDEEQIKQAVASVTKTLNGAGLDGLINNAGIAVAGPMEFVPIPELRRQLEINVIAQVAVTQAFLPLLRQSKGRIINIGSVSGLVTSPFIGPYSASKFALEAVNDALRLELETFGLRVIMIEPSSIATPIWDKSLSAGDELEKIMPPVAQEYYGKGIAGMRRMARHMGKKGAPVESVTDVIEQALTHPKPKTRYLAGQGLRMFPILRYLPDRWRDRLVLGQLQKISNYKPKH